MPCVVARKTVDAEALELLPVGGFIWIKARYSTNSGSGAAFKEKRILNWRAKVPKFHQATLLTGWGIDFALRA